MHRFCAEEDAEVPYEEIASGYETDDGELVILTDAELATAAPRRRGRSTSRPSSISPTSTRSTSTIRTC